MMEMDLLPTFFRSANAAKAMGVSKKTVRRLFDEKTLDGYYCDARYVERRSMVRWLLASGLRHDAIPANLICDVVTVGIALDLVEGLRRLLPEVDFRVSASPTTRIPRVAILDLSDDPEVPSGVELSVGIAPMDGVRDRWKKAVDVILAAPVSSQKIVDVLRRAVT